MRTVLALPQSPSRTARPLRWLAATLAPALLLAACGDDPNSGDDGAQIVVTTTILGDVVRNLVGDDATVEVVMPPNASPHDFAPSAKQAAVLRSADVVVANGLGFESGLVQAVDAAAGDGATVLHATDYVETAPFRAHTDHEDDEHADAAGAADDHAGHDHDGDDPHVFTDPARMAAVAEGLAADLIATVPELDTPAGRERAAAYVEELRSLDAEVARILEPIPAQRRLLVTNHDVFGYFADRYDFEVVGVVIPGGSTLAEPSAADLAKLAGAIEEAGVPAVFVETSTRSRVAQALAGEAVGVEVVELYSESLGAASSDAATYIDMVRTNATRIAVALVP